MTKKDFRAIATGVQGVVKFPFIRWSPDAQRAMKMLVERVADVCAESNGSFDRDRFYKACGL